jgi:DNA adenine methylase
MQKNKTDQLTLKNPSHYSPLRYPGGKTRLANFLSDLIEKQTNSKDLIFVEPYAGGAGASLRLLFQGKVAEIIINDFDKAIYSFWNVAVNDTDKLIHKIKKTQVSIAEWKRQREIYKNGGFSEFDLAFAVFFLNRTNRSGIIEGGPIGGVAQGGDWKINARFNKKTLIERLERLKEYKNKIKVLNMDGVDLLEKLKTRKDLDKIFVFLDPPYVKKGELLYLNHYNKKDHQKLSQTLRTSTLNWVMTYDDTKYIKDLYSTYSVKIFNIAYRAHTLKFGKEVFISPTKIPIPKFSQKVY